MIIEFNKQIGHLIKSKKKYLKEFGTKEGYENEKKRTKEFVDSFNKEAKKQNSPWYAEIQKCIHSFGMDKGEEFILTHLCKKVVSGWWIFNTTDLIKLHICVYRDHMSFVENDYVVSEYGIKKNDKVFYFLPELTPVLEKIPQAVFILPKEEINNLGKRMKDITKRVGIIEKEVLNGR